MCVALEDIWAKPDKNINNGQKINLNGSCALESNQRRSSKIFKRNKRDQVLTLTNTAVWQQSGKAKDCWVYDYKRHLPNPRFKSSQSQKSPRHIGGTESRNCIREGNRLQLAWTIRMQATAMTIQRLEGLSSFSGALLNRLRSSLICIMKDTTCPQSP